MDKFLQWFVAKNFFSVHSFTLYVTLWMTWESFMWAAHYAETSTRTGGEITMIITAVLLPVTALQGFSFRNYTNLRVGALT